MAVGVSSKSASVVMIVSLCVVEVCHFFMSDSVLVVVFIVVVVLLVVVLVVVVVFVGVCTLTFI